MAFPYKNPNVDLYVNAGFSFARIKQSLASAGDIFEISQGAHGFCIGPDSDVANVTVAYFDPLSTPAYSSQAVPVQTNLSMLTITPERPWSGYIPIVNKEGSYVPSNVPGRMLMWPTALFDATTRPSNFDPVADGLVFEHPVIDIIQYFSPPPATLPGRADKTYYYDNLPFGSSGICYVMVPFYGRRAGYVWAAHDLSIPGCEFTIIARGLNYRIAENTPAQIDAVIEQAPVLTHTGGPQTLVTRPNFYDVETAYVAGSNQYSLWDYLIVQVEKDDPMLTANCAIRITVSDRNP